MNQSCESSADLQMYQHCLYAVVYCVILAPGLLGNVLALWVFRVYVRETKKAVVFMMNLAVADLLQVNANTRKTSIKKHKTHVFKFMFLIHYLHFNKLFTLLIEIHFWTCLFSWDGGEMFQR